MKHFKILVLVTITLFSYNQADAQIKKLDFFEEETLDFEQYKNHTGEILFSNEEFPRELSESKYIKSYNLGDKLAIRAFMKNSPANSMMIQIAESGKKAKHINAIKGSLESGYMIYKMYLDGKFISNTSHAKSFDNEEFTSLPSQRADIKDDNGQYFGESLYDDLLNNEDLLTPGVHKLKIELVPICKSSRCDGFEFKPIATGEIDLIVPAEIEVSRSNCFPEAVKSDPNSEEEMLAVYNEYTKKNTETKALKIILTNLDWKIIRNEQTGQVIKKVMTTIVVIQKGEELWYDRNTFEMNYDGINYSKIGLPSNPDLYNGKFPRSAKKVNKACIKFL